MLARSATLFISLLLIFAAPIGLFAAGNHETPTLVTIQGQIFDQDQAPVAGARVTAVPQDGSKTVTSLTDAEGGFALELFPKAYVLKVAADGFTDISQRLNVEQNDLKTLEITLRVRSVTAVVNVDVSSELATETTRTATKTYMALRDVPQSISIVGKQQISDQSMTGIGDVVRYMPGISAHQGENNRDQIIIRGQSSSADFFINGVRDDVQYYRDLYNLDRIETLRGPNALVFGRGGGGGVINRVTKEAGFAPSREFTLQGSSFGGARVT